MPLFFLLVVPFDSSAHTVPSLTLEAVFESAGHYVLKVNVDPRLFLAAEPSSLPPVEAGWYRDQSTEQRAQTEVQAANYLRQALLVSFGGATHELPKATFQPIDGATNEPMSPASQEVHLLAEFRGTTGKSPFHVRLGPQANTSLILLTTIGETAERRPMVIFPGETSVGIQVPQPPVETPKVDAPMSSMHWGWWLGGAGVALLMGWRWWQK